MKIKNEFTQETRLLFFYNQNCFWCGRYGWTALHHILGRISNSPLNASPIHNEGCHIGNGLLEKDISRAKLLLKTWDYLRSEGYALTKEDKEFVKDNKELYLWKPS